MLCCSVVLKVAVFLKLAAFSLQGENPIFKQATTTFQNPTYGGK